LRSAGNSGRRDALIFTLRDTADLAPRLAGGRG